MDKGRRSMPRLNLISEDNLDLPGVFTVVIEEGFQDIIDGQGDLSTERADIVHYTPRSVS